MSEYISLKVYVIRWACERVGLIFVELCEQKIFKGLSKEENGFVKLTLKQAEQLSKKLKYPFIYLLLDAPVESIDILPISDFRTINNTLPKLNINLCEQIRYCKNQQDWFSEYAQNNGLNLFELNGKFSINDNSAEAGTILRDFFKISYRNIKTAEDYLKKIKTLFEGQGILVCSSKVLKNTTTRLRLSDFRGFSLYDEVAPLIFINGNDSVKAQIFTLCHELGHICLGLSGVSDVKKDNNRETEKWCNNFSANILMPKEDIIKDFESSKSINDFLNKATNKYFVSILALLVRLLNLEILDQCRFKKLWAEHEKQYKDYLEKNSKDKKTGGNYYKNVNSRLSNLLTRAVISSTSVGETPFRDAAYLLGIKSISTFDKLAKVCVEAV